MSTPSSHDRLQQHNEPGEMDIQVQGTIVGMDLVGQGTCPTGRVPYLSIESGPKTLQTNAEMLEETDVMTQPASA